MTHDQLPSDNDPRPAPIWSCSSVSRATVICSGSRGFESNRNERYFPCWAKSVPTCDILIVGLLAVWCSTRTSHQMRNDTVVCQTGLRGFRYQSTGGGVVDTCKAPECCTFPNLLHGSSELYVQSFILSCSTRGQSSWIHPSLCS